MAQLMFKPKWDKHEDLVLHPLQPHKYPGTTHTCNTSTGKAETAKSLQLDEQTSQAKLVGSVKDPALNNKVETAIKQDSQYQPHISKGM